MKLSDYFHESLLNLFSAKLRSFLALLGILVGTAAVVAMTSGGKLATNEALKQFKTLGTDLLSVNINETAENSSPSSSTGAYLTVENALSLGAIDKAVWRVAPYIQLYQPLAYEGHELNGSLLGVTNDFAKINKLHVLQGRFVSLLDRYQFYCVIGYAIYEKMRELGCKNVIGKQIKVGKDIFTIIGVADYSIENSFIYANINESVMVPILSASILNKYAYINNIIFQFFSNEKIDEIKSRLDEKLTQFMPNKVLYFHSAKEIIQSMQKQSQILTILLGLIGSISLIVGGIGVMNIMLVSIIERKREIGVRLAVGAKRRDIRLLFLIEAIVLAFSGGMLGIVLGIMIAYFIALFSHWDFEIFFMPVFIGFFVSTVTGIFFGYYPAHKAAMLDPVEMLRQ